MNRRQKRRYNRRAGKYNAVVDYDGRRYLVRIGRDGKNRYCLYHFSVAGHFYLRRTVIAGGLTKLAARAMLKLMKESGNE